MRIKWKVYEGVFHVHSKWEKTSINSTTSLITIFTAVITGFGQIKSSISII